MNIFKFLICLFIATGALSGNSGELVKNGKAIVQGIVIPDDKYCSSVNAAAKELSYHLKKSSGNDIPVIKENLSKTDGKYIYLGNCRKNRSAGIITADYSRNAGVILIDKNNVYIAGNDTPKRSRGTLFSTYAFLEKFLGVRWLWPGCLGEVIPLHKNIVLPECRENITPRFAASRWRVLKNDGWSSERSKEKYYKETRIWLTRHRFSFDQKYNIPHAFTGYFKKFGKNHPDFFALLPDGTRRSNPYSWHRGAGKHVSMCVTSPGLVKQIIENWRAKSPRPSIINLNENDTAGYCVCENCLSADNSPVPNKIRREKATEKFLAKKKEWPKELGSVSDRYCRFYLNVQKVADKIAPGHSIAGLVYANYSEPPTEKIKLNKRIILRFCPPFMFPWTNKKVSEYKRILDGWGKTGAQLMFRPNFTIVQCFPIMYQDVFYYLFNAAYNNGMSVTDMDSLTGHYGVHGPVNYVIASLNHDKNSSLQTLENDYFSAFGAATKLVKQYFELMKKVSMRQDFNSYLKTIEGGSTFYTFFLNADALFTPEVMKRANEILTEAANVSGLDPKPKERVEFLRTGLKHSQILMDTQTAFRKYKKNGDVEEFKEKLNELYRFRASIENIGAVNVGMCYRWEKLSWPQPLLMEALEKQRKVEVNSKSADRNKYDDDFSTRSWRNWKSRMGKAKFLHNKFEGRNDKGSLEIITEKGNPKKSVFCFLKPLPVKPGKTYAATVWVKVLKTEAGAKFSVSFKGLNAKKLLFGSLRPYSAELNDNTAQDWKRLELIFTIPQSGEWEKVKYMLCMLVMKDTSEGRVLFDDFSFSEKQ